MAHGPRKKQLEFVDWIIRMYILPILLYGADTWSMTVASYRANIHTHIHTSCQSGHYIRANNVIRWRGQRECRIHMYIC